MQRNAHAGLARGHIHKVYGHGARGRAAEPRELSGLALTSGNDSPERDPTGYRLEGSNDGTTYSLVAEGPVPAFNGREARQEILFTNLASFIMYRLTFPTIADATKAIAIQIAEIELLGR